MSTDQRIKEIQERSDKATLGPWQSLIVPDESRDCSKVEINGQGYDAIADLCGRDKHSPDWAAVIDTGTFIAASRADVPWLVKLVQKQREALWAVVAADRNAVAALIEAGFAPQTGEEGMKLAKQCQEALNYNPDDE